MNLNKEIEKLVLPFTIDRLDKQMIELKELKKEALWKKKIFEELISQIDKELEQAEGNRLEANLLLLNNQ